MSKKDDLCYLPTQNLCSLNEFLPESFMPKNKEQITRQEIVTYRNTDHGIIRTTFVRNFVKNWHYDEIKEERLG